MILHHRQRVVVLVFLLLAAAATVQAWLLGPPPLTYTSAWTKQQQQPPPRRATTTTRSTTTSALSSSYSARDSFSLIVLGDLHLEDDMTAHEQARDDCIAAVREQSLLLSNSNNDNHDNTDDTSAVVTLRDVLPSLENARAGDLTSDQLELLLAHKQSTASNQDGLIQTYLVSLGDLGRKDIRHEPGDAGTTQSFLDAKTYLDGFGVPYELVSGNHDLEGLDEFDTDEANLQAWLDCFEKPAPYFCRQIADKTLVVGLSTVRFRDAPYSSHEVHVDDDQLDWFIETIQAHPASEGWKIIVISHAPIMGSGLRVLQNVHVVNGCAWLNHCSENRSVFIETVRANPQIKLWCSGHFHLSHDFEDSISTVGACTFVQVGVVGPVSTRDGRRQTRLVQGCADRWRVYTVQHHQRDTDDNDNKATVRLDAELRFVDATTTTSHVEPRWTTGADDDDDDNDNGDQREDWFQAYTPRAEDGCYLESPEGSIAASDALDTKVCWWHMKDGRVIGLHQGQLVEYDADTLSPLGIIVNQKTLAGRDVVVVENGTVLVLVDSTTQEIEVVHPNEDGSYWRKFQRNKRVRQEEKAREAIAKLWMEQQSKR